MADSDIFQLLEHDHREVEAYFRQLKGAKGGRGGKADTTFQKLTEELLRHMTAEEKVFYTALAGEPPTKELIAEGYKEHGEARELIASVTSAPGDAVWLRKVAKLEKAIEHHVHEEEHEIFPVARKLLGERRAAAMGSAFEDQKKSMK